MECKLVYCKDSTCELSISKRHTSCLVCLDQLVCDETISLSTRPNIFSDEVIVLNLDCVERNIATDEHRSRKRTVDLVFAGKSGEVSIQVVLVELRYNYINMQKLKRVVLIEKVDHSKELLIGNDIFPKVFFVFETDLKQQAKNRLNRMVPKVPSDFEVIDNEELNSLFFS